MIKVVEVKHSLQRKEKERNVKLLKEDWEFEQKNAGLQKMAALFLIGAP